MKKVWHYEINLVQTKTKYSPRAEHFQRINVQQPSIYMALR